MLQRLRSMFGGSSDTQAQILQQLRELNQRMCSLESSLTRLGSTIMHNLDDVLADVNAETTLITGVSSLLTGLKAAVDAAKGDQAKIDQIFAVAEANKAALAGALAANTPAAPTV